MVNVHPFYRAQCETNRVQKYIWNIFPGMFSCDVMCNLSLKRCINLTMFLFHRPTCLSSNNVLSLQQQNHFYNVSKMPPNLFSACVWSTDICEQSYSISDIFRLSVWRVLGPEKGGGLLVRWDEQDETIAALFEICVGLVGFGFHGHGLRFASHVKLYARTANLHWKLSFPDTGKTKKKKHFLVGCSFKKIHLWASLT